MKLRNFILETGIGLLKMDDESTLCLLCQNALSTAETVTVSRGLETIKQCSIRRNDVRVYKKLKDASSTCIHVHCRKKYTNPKYIQQASESGASPCAQPLPESTVPRLRSSLNLFDFKEMCLFCGKAADIKAESKKPLGKREKICNVETMPFKESVIDAAKSRNDEWGEIVQARVESTIDLVAAEARYHNSCCKNYFYIPTSNRPGRPEDSRQTDAFGKLCDFLNSSDECQYSFSDLQEKCQEFLSSDDQCFTDKTLKSKLEAYYGDNIIITTAPGRKSVVCLRDTGHKILTKAWYEKKSENEEEERRRIVRTAAEIIREDIRSRCYDTDMYPPLENLMEQSDALVPETLKLLVEGIIMKNKRANKIDLKRKCIAIEHSIISATRPRSFLSMVHVGLAVYLHRLYGSKNLIQALSCMGFCASYNEANLYVTSALLGNHREIVEQGSFIQYVFDNADINVRTLNGLGTFHSMGGIRSITPASAIQINNNVIRLQKQPLAQNVGLTGRVQLVTYSTTNKNVTQATIIEDVSAVQTSTLISVRRATILDCLWMCGTWLERTPRPGWSGYMELAMEGYRTYEKSRVIPMPFISHDPSNLSTIFTSLLEAARDCKKHKQNTCFVTFDQPLFSKASRIVALSEPDGELQSVVVRLGGFHLLMSFMGAVGNIMAGSGLEELWATVYAKTSVIHMVTGHAYARALRAHFLTQLALAVNAFQGQNINEETRAEVNRLHAELLSKTETPEAVSDSAAVKEVLKALETSMQAAAASSRTAKLWQQYFEQVQLMRMFIRAERCGDWQLHLHCVQQMLPHFHAAGHLAYAKSAHLYLQQMMKLETRMTPEEYHKFTNEGYFTIRRTNKLWAGIWSDMTIEQTLMRSMKTSGGLTHGRGVTDSVLSQWVLGMPICAEVCDNIEAFCGVSFSTSEQHVELRDSRQSRDISDTTTFIKWIMMHEPFSAARSELISLSTGIVADDSINCASAVECGMAALKRMVGKSFEDIHLKRSDKVLSLATMNSAVKVNDDVVVVDTMQLFNRIICTVKSDEELANCLKYELSPTPPSLFENSMMRKIKNKAIMYEIFKSVLTSESPESDIGNATDCAFVVDGGFLLHRVVWPRIATYEQLYEVYVSYVLRHYGASCTVVFDGYDETNNTKAEEHRRRAAKFVSVDILFDDAMEVTTGQEKFLRNPRNKTRFIECLTIRFRRAGIYVKQAVSDADVLIVNSAIELSHQDKNVILIGEDTDLLVILAVLSDPNRSITFRKPGKGFKPDTDYISNQIQNALGNLRDHVLFLHAVTGCDTTSAPYRQGKKKAFKLLKQNAALRNTVNIFNSSTASHEEIATAGEDFMLKLYGCKGSSNSLDQYRYQEYMRITPRMRIDKPFRLAVLPPTSSAVRQHSYRVYHQVQLWRNRQLPPTEWGWKMRGGVLLPIPTLDQPASDELLHLLYCNCKSDCIRNCACRKAGLECTPMCGKCNGYACSNAPRPDDDAYETSEDTPFDTDTDTESEEEDSTASRRRRRISSGGESSANPLRRIRL